MKRRLLDFDPVLTREISFNQLVADLTIEDLRELTNDMIDTMLDLIANCEDVDVTFEPEDPEAEDQYAADDAEANIAWTLGHVIVHTTASSEESAALAAELARGVAWHGRSRSEVPWQTIATIEQCRHRLEESRRMRLASLEMWPDEPDLDNRHMPYRFVGELNAVGYFVTGLFHDDSHLAQISNIVEQARAARS
ncbi:MAG TPA: DinB family protein [Anaerolineae bacterium]|nr:DinB family protein [Anaerolineae bacterium]